LPMKSIGSNGASAALVRSSKDASRQSPRLRQSGLAWITAALAEAQ
jgi:hypothetical protein